MLPKKRLLLLILFLAIVSLICVYASLSSHSQRHSLSKHALSASVRGTSWTTASGSIAKQLSQVAKAKTKDRANVVKDHVNTIRLADKTISNSNASSKSGLQSQEIGASKVNLPKDVHLHNSSRSGLLKHLWKLKPKSVLVQKSGLSLQGQKAKKRESVRRPKKNNNILSQHKTQHTGQHSIALSDPEHKLGQTDYGLYSLYKDVDVVAKYCTPGLCLPVNGPETQYHQGCLRNALSLIDLRRLYNGQNLTLNHCSCKLENKKIKYGRVALVSLPGSGNTWARGLLEQATGLCTGSMWCDPGLRASHFCGEGLRDVRLLAVKNHDPTIRWKGQRLQRRPGLSDHNKPEFEAAIFIHRNPSDAIVAEHNRAIASALWEASVREGHRNKLKLSNHLLTFGEEYFGNNSDWDSKVRELMLVWERMVKHLLLDSMDRPVLLVHYEDLKADLVREVKRMVKFLGYDMPEDVLRERITQQFNDFYRNHTPTFEHFTPAQKKFINDAYDRVAATGVFNSN